MLRDVQTGIFLGLTWKQRQQVKRAKSARRRGRDPALLWSLQDKTIILMWSSTQVQTYPRAMTLDDVLIISFITLHTRRRGQHKTPKSPLSGVPLWCRNTLLCECARVCVCVCRQLICLMRRSERTGREKKGRAQGCIAATNQWRTESQQIWA